MGGWPSIRAKALSRRTNPVRCASTVVMVVAEGLETLADSTLRIALRSRTG